MKAFLDQCGPILDELKASKQNLEQSKSSTQVMVGSMTGASRTVAEQLLTSIEAELITQTSCLEYALKAEDRLLGQLDSTCERLLSELVSIARDPKSLDAILQGDRANPAEQQEASELLQLK